MLSKTSAKPAEMPRDSMPASDEHCYLQLLPICRLGFRQGFSLSSSDDGFSPDFIGLPASASLSCGNWRYGQEKRHIW